MSDPTLSKPARQCHLRWVKADEIGVNPVAQREFRLAHAQSILDKFDIDKFQVPHVNRRADGSLYVMEGQHSLWAYRQWVGDGQQVQVWLYDGLSEHEEAEFFLSLNDKKAVPALPKFRAAVTAGRVEESDIDRIVRANDCTIGGHSSPNAITAIGALTAIYQQHGAKVLGLTLRIIRDSFTDGGYERPVLLGIAKVVARYGDSLDEKRMVQKLSGIKNGWKGLVQRTSLIKDAKGCTQPEAAAAAVVEFYNAGRGGVKLMTWWAA